MASVAKKAKLSKTVQKPCPYGASCYRKNPAHLAEFSHPKAEDVASPSSSDQDDKNNQLQASVDTSSPPPCKYGAKCYRKNLLHFAEYSHPVLASAKTEDNSGGDTDVYDSDDDKVKKQDSMSKDASDILNRGMSLVKSFSKMTEQERRDLIKKAFEAKQKLKEELEATKKQMEEKDKELNLLQEKLSKGILMVEGEKEALESDKTVYFTLLPERQYKEGSAAQTHFRLAESQFYRLLSADDNAGYRVTKVQYVVNPSLVKRFKAARENLKSARGEDMSYPVLGFHGTDDKNIIPICETGFKMPGDSGFNEKSDAGWYGAGIYFSEYPAYSMDYIEGATRLLLCQVLPGKVFNCKEINEGSKKQKGYDSHMSPDKKEIVIFDSHCILPSYIVHYSFSSSDFTYKAAPGMKRIRKVAGPKLHPGTREARMNQAKKSPFSRIFEGKFLLFETKTAKEKKALVDLVIKHKGIEGSLAKYDILVLGKTVEAEDNSAVNKALQEDKPVVTEEYIIECILHKDFLDPDYFLHSLYD